MGLPMDLAYFGLIDLAMKKLMIVPHSPVIRIPNASMDSVKKPELDCFQLVNRSDYHPRY